MKSFTLLLVVFAFSACSFHSTARHWNGLVGPDGQPVYAKSTTNVGVNILVAFRLFGGTEIDSMVDTLTSEIGAEGGDTVRIIESSAENYWYGFPPLTWVLTPVITTVTAEYRPTAERVAEDRAADEAAKSD